MINLQTEVQQQKYAISTIENVPREAQQQKALQLAEQQRAQVTDADLLATVDSDISRTVPAAMEPLAQLMDESQSQ